MNKDMYTELMLRFAKELHDVGVTEDMRKIVEAQYSRPPNNGPLAIVIEQNQVQTAYHQRIRVMWMGTTVPIQASVISTSSSRISSWVHPKYFKVISESR